MVGKRERKSNWYTIQEKEIQSSFVRLSPWLLLIFMVAGAASLELFIQGCGAGNNNGRTVSVDELNIASDSTVGSRYFDPFRFDTSEISDPVEREFIAYGRKLIDITARLIGPMAADASMHFAGNSLNCSICHLDGGTQPLSAPFIGVWGTYPDFRQRSNTIGTLEDRIKGCMERSMNGRGLPIDGKEMKAILSYIKCINKGVPTGAEVSGMGFIDFKAPQRAADLHKGKVVFAKECSACHGKDGRGLKAGEGAFICIHPFGGEESFNDGADMHRLLTAATFIKGNMPYGVAVNQPKLLDEKAYRNAGGRSLDNKIMQEKEEAFFSLNVFKYSFNKLKVSFLQTDSDFYNLLWRILHAAPQPGTIHDWVLCTNRWNSLAALFCPPCA